MKEGRAPVPENGFRRFVKRYEETGNLKNHFRSGRPKLSPNPVE